MNKLILSTGCLFQKGLFQNEFITLSGIYKNHIHVVRRNVQLFRP